MAILSDTEIFAAALEAGFTPDQAVTMTAIALAESGGNTGALNSTGEYSVGLWQINTAVHDWDPAVATDPANNARMAFEVSGGGSDISRWTVTHETKGARYLSFRARAEAAAAASGHPDARGQWDPPHDYHDNAVGAAPNDSTSLPLHEPGTIPDSLDGVDVGAPDVAADATAAPATSAFDADGDGVFDAVEEWLGEDLLPDAANLAQLDEVHVHAPVEPIDVGSLHNGRVNEDLLQSVSGGSDALLAGAPANSWQAMVAAAAADGVDITYSDAYRPLADQERLARELGLYSEGGRAAAPGHSNHGLGLAVDVNQHPDTMAWLDEHAAEYGWVADVPREPWHFNYRESLDPDPGRGPIGGTGSSTEPTVVNVFDTDGDGVYDGIEDWMAASGTPLPGGAEETHDHSHDAAHDDPHDHPHDDPHDDPHDEVLAPIDDAPAAGLAEVLGRFDLDGHDDLVIDGLTDESQAGLRSALADFVVERAEIDRDSFFRQYDERVTTGDGAIDIADVLDSFGVDLDLDL